MNHKSLLMLGPICFLSISFMNPKLYYLCQKRYWYNTAGSTRAYWYNTPGFYCPNAKHEGCKINIVTRGYILVKPRVQKSRYAQVEPGVLALLFKDWKLPVGYFWRLKNELVPYQINYELIHMSFSILDNFIDNSRKKIIRKKQSSNWRGIFSNITR